MQQNNDIKKKDHLNKMKERNANLKSVSIECPFCGASSNLLNIKGHLNSKKCKQMKALFLENATTDEEKTADYRFNKFIIESIKKANRDELERNEY